MHLLAIALPYWLEPATIGAFFTAAGLLKVYGLAQGTIGGRDKPWFQYATGTCPTWVGRGWRGWLLRIGFPWLLLGIGVWNLGRLAVALYRGH